MLEVSGKYAPVLRYIDADSTMVPPSRPEYRARFVRGESNVRGRKGHLDQESSPIMLLGLVSSLS